MVFAVGAFTWPHFHTLLHFFFPPVSSPVRWNALLPLQTTYWEIRHIFNLATLYCRIAEILKYEMGEPWVQDISQTWQQVIIIRAYAVPKKLRTTGNKLGTPDNQDKSTENFSKEWCCEFLRSAVFCASLRSLKLPGRHRTALQDLSSKLYPCHYKTEFCPHKGHLPIAAATGR